MFAASELFRIQQSPDDGMKRVQTVERAFATLELMVELGGSATVSELAKCLDLSMAGVHRQLRTMARLGYVHQRANKSYCLGPGLIRLGEGAVEQHILAARPVLALTAQQLGETASLVMLDGDYLVHAVQVQSSRALRSITHPDATVPAHATGTGRVLLAELTDNQIWQAMAREGTLSAAYRQRVMASIRQIRADGYCVDDSDNRNGLRSCAVPTPSNGRPFAVSVTGSRERLSHINLNVIGSLQQAARQIGQSLQPVAVRNSLPSPLGQ
jgi:IclR family acetate operon transcriptional repressor